MRFGVHLLFALILALWSVRVLGPVSTWETRIAAEAAAAARTIPVTADPGPADPGPAA
jgi:P pilus assembly chaperone PapD